MGLLNRLEREVVKRLKPWLAPGHDARLKVTPSASQLLLQLCDISFDVVALNEAAMSTTSLLLHEVVVEEVDLKLSLLSFPVVTVVLRGVHVVVKPRTGNEPHALSNEMAKDPKTEAVLEDSPKPKGEEKQQKEASLASFIVDSLTNFALSSLRLELHDCSVKFISYSLKPLSYVCSASLDSFILEEGSAGGDKTADGIFQASIDAVRSRWEQKVGSVKKMCIFRGLALNLETVSNRSKDTIFNSRENFGNFGRRRKSSSFTNRRQNKPSVGKGYVGEKRDQLLLFEVVSVAVSLRGTEFLGLVVEIPEVFVGLDAREIDVLMVLAAQANGAGVRETDQTLDMAMLKVRKSRLESKRTGLSISEFSSDVNTELNSEGEIVEPGDEDRSGKESHQEDSGADGEAEVVRIPAHRVFHLLAWRLWVHNLSEVVGFAIQIIFVILLVLRSLPALLREAWQLTVGMRHSESELAEEKLNSSEEQGENPTTASSDDNSESSLFKVVQSSGPTFEVYFSRGLFTLVGAADDDTDETAGDSSKLSTGGVLPGVHMTLERISLEYGLDDIGSGGRLGVGHWQVDLISVVASQSLPESTHTLREGRWKKNASDTLQLIKSKPYKARMKANDRFKDLQDTGDVPQAAIARKRHYDWQDNVANAWSQHEWKLPADLKGDESDVASSAFKGDVSRAFLIAEFGTADVGNDGLKVLGGLMTCGLSMGCLDFYSDSTTSYRITPLIDQLSATSVSGQNAEPDKALADPNDSEVDYEEQLLDYLNLCRHYIGLAVPTSRVELSVVIESSKFTFAATMGQFENDQLTENEGPMHSSRGSSLVVEIGSLQLLTWPASSKEALSELEARVPVKDAAPLGWWDDCVDEKLWLMRPPTPSFPADTLGSEEEQIGNNLYFALEDAGVKLRTDRNRKSVVPVLGPISCVMQSSFCRDDLYSQKGVIKSASVSLDGKLAPLAVHLYLEEVAIFQEIVDFGNALMEGFGSSTDSNEDQPNMKGTSAVEPLKNASTGQQTTDANATADAPAKILFVFFVSLQLEAFQIVLGDRRIGESIEGHTNTVDRRVSSSQERHSRNQGDRHAVQKTRFPGNGRYCYFATLPFSFDMSLGDGYETRISLELNGAHMGVIQKQHQKVEQEQSLSQSLLDGTVLDVMKLFQIAVTGFALERSKITICGPKLIGQVERQSSMHRERADVETHVNTSLSPADGATASGGKDSAFHEQTPEQGPSVDGPLPHDEEPGIKLPGHNRSDDPHWLVVNVEIGSISVTDDLREALIDKIMLLVSGSSTLHIELKIGKDSRNVTMDVEGGLAIIQTAALHSLVEYVNDHLNLLSEPATSSYRSVTREFSEKFSEQSSNNADSTSSSLKNSGRSASLPPWAGTKNLSKMRRLASAPRRLQAATELTPELAPKKGYDGNLSASLVGFSLVLVQRGSTVVAPVEGFIMEVDTKGQCNVKHGSVIQVSAAVTRASILGLQGRTFGRMNTRSGRKPQFRNNLMGATNDEPGQGSQKSHHSHHTLSPSPSGMSEDYNDHHEWNEQPFEDDGAWKPLDESHSYILERLSLTASMEKVPADKHPDFWKWRNSWKGHFSMVGVDFAITTSEVQLLLSVTEPLSGLSGSSSPPSVPEPEYERVKDQIDEPEAEEPGTDSYLPDGAVIAIQDMNEHYYLAVEEKGANTGTFRLMGVLHFSLVGDRALFKVRYQRNKNGGKTKWFSLLSLLASDSNGEPYRVHFLPGSGLAEVTTTHDNSGELWECIESTEEKSEGSEELGFQTSRRAFHLVNQKSKSGLSLSEGFPMLVQRPGNSFKLRILAREKEEPGTVKLVSLEHGDKDEVDHGHDHDTSQELTDSAIAATVIPDVTCEIHDFTFTLLHEASGGVHLLPLIRMCMQDIGAVLQMGSGKTRVLFGCSLSLDFFQAQNSCWVAMINPVGVELLYRARNENLTPGAVRKKTPVTLFCRLRKVDIIISELSLDTLLFLIGALDLAGPYTLRHSPVLANRCQVENRTGLDLVCRFDHGNAKREEVTESLESSAFLIRHTTSRRDLSSAEVATSVEVYLQKHGGGHSSSVQVSLVEPGLIATRTRLKLGEGRKNGGPGPILVVDVLRQSQGGVSLTVSPMVRVRNATGQFLELQCRRPNQDGDGALVLLEDGDTIDDCMGSFDALMLEGELRKALSSFNVGNFLLSIRPASGSASESGEFGKQDEALSAYDWSDDVKGAKAVRISNLFEKFQYDFKKRIGGRNSDVAFGTVFCPAKRSDNKDDGLYFLIRTTKRQVPVVRLDKELEGGKPPVASWQEQQEFLLLPTIRIFNLFTSSISAKLLALAPGRADGKAGSQLLPKTEITVKAGKVELMYADLGVLSLVIKHVKSGLTSKQIPVFGRDKRSPDASKEGGGLRETELDVDFGDGAHYGKMKVRQDDDGVLEVVLYTKYALFNDSHVPLLYCAPRQKNSYLWRRGKKNDSNLEWPSEETVSSLRPGSRISWFNKSSKVMMKQALPDAQPALLDLDNLAGSTEISLKVSSKENADQRVQLGVELQLPAIGDTNPTRTVHLAPRYIVVNKSNDVMCICQDGFQNDESAVMELSPGEKTALNCRVAPEEGDEKNKSDDGQNPMQEPLSVRFKPRGQEWNWSGPVCAAALGSFWIKIRRQGQMGFANSHKQVKGRMLFALAEVQEDSPSLLMCFRRHSADAIPYRIENGLRSDALLYSQKGLTQTEVLEAAASVDYVWDDLGLTHKLVVTIRGTQLCQVINMDKIREWKRFGAARRGKGFSFQLPFADESKESDNEGDENSTGTMFRHVGYEVIADGPTRVLRICLHSDSNKQSGWQSTMRRPKTEVEVKIPLFFFSLVEPVKQKNDASEVEKDAGEQTTEKRVLYAPIVSARITHLLIEGLVTDECTLGQLKVERLDMDVKWQGSTVIHMMRVRGQNGDDKPGQTVLHIAGVMAHRGTNPIQLHYASLLLQAVDLNIDEDTLMKLAPFYRVSLAPSIGPSRLIYYERFEIHPIKILASYTPGNPQADYTSAQETLRAFLHTVVKVPAVRGFKVELNGVLLSNALLTYAQLAVKCAQHYSWYAMRAVYIARGSSLLPPGFASLFDDSAASSLDVFFDPSNGSVDVQGLTLGMFNILSKGLRKKGQGGSSRLLGDVEQTVKLAGSNILFAVVTEVSDSVLKGAEASGLDGLLSGFRRGILNVAMRPAVLRSAVAQGGSTRRIKLDHSVGMDEVYIEGYLQAMLDAQFRQDYLKVKVTDEEVLLRNLPPNTSLMEEIMSAVKKFLIAEGLLTGESSLATARPTRRQLGNNERRIGPAMIALCEQLLVVIAVQGLRKQAKKYVHFPRGAEEKPVAPEKAVVPVEEPAQPQEGMLPRVRHAATNFVLSSGLAYLDGRLCRHIPNTLVRRIVSGFLLSFME